MREVVLISGFVKTDAVRTRGSAIASTPRLFLRVEMQAAHQIVGFVVEVTKLVRRRLLVRCCIIKSVPCAIKSRKRTNLTLLRCATQHTRKRRSLTPNTLHARIVLLPPLQSSNALSVLRLHLLESDNVGLQPPRLVITTVWSESLALRIHLSREPSESPVQTLSSRLRHAHLLLLCISRPARVSPWPSSSPSGTGATVAFSCSLSVVPVLLSSLVVKCSGAFS